MLPFLEQAATTAIALKQQRQTYSPLARSGFYGVFMWSHDLAETGGWEKRNEGQGQQWPKGEQILPLTSKCDNEALGHIIPSPLVSTSRQYSPFDLCVNLLMSVGTPCELGGVQINPEFIPRPELVIQHNSALSHVDIPALCVGGLPLDWDKSPQGDVSWC